MSEQQKQVKAALKECVARIKELKAIRRANAQWVNGPFGYELETRKGEATVLCAARAASRKRAHAIRLPRVLFIDGRWTAVKTQEEFAARVEEAVAARFPVPPAEAPAPEQRPAA